MLTDELLAEQDDNGATVWHRIIDRQHDAVWPVPLTA